MKLQDFLNIRTIAIYVKVSPMQFFLIIKALGNGLMLVDNDVGGLVVEDSDGELPGEVNAG